MKLAFSKIIALMYNFIIYTHILLNVVFNLETFMSFPIDCQTKAYCKKRSYVCPHTSKRNFSVQILF